MNTFRRAMVATLALLVVACDGPQDAAASQAQRPAATKQATQASVTDSRRTAITKAIDRVAPSVVTVQTQARERVRTDPFFDFFGFGGNQSRVVPGLGTGFVVDASGIIVTNAHVVANADTISVMFRDGSVAPATLLGTDETNDIAVLRIRKSGLSVVTLGNSSEVAIGEWAIAIGNPYGFVLGNSEPTVTVGVISGVGRNLLARGDGAGSYLDMIQTDAAINPGNSGGPLVNADGEVIGVNSSIYSPSGGSVGIGFSIPINRVRHVVEDLVARGSVRRPWIGVRMRYPERDNVRATIATGAVINTVTQGSPAARAGLQPADVILTAGSRTMRNPYDWEAVLLDLRPGQNIDLRVKRNTREFDVSVRIEDLPEVSAPKVQVLQEMELVTLTPAMRAERSLISTNGALILRVGENIAEQLGLRSGDLIIQIGQTQISSAQEAKNALDALAGRGSVQMRVERNGRGLWTDPFRIGR
jgi:serine protease Do